MKIFPIRFNHVENTWQFWSWFFNEWANCTPEIARECFDDCGVVYVKGFS